LYRIVSYLYSSVHIVDEFSGDVSTEIRLERDLFVWQEKESHLKKLRETFDMETEQETREAKRDKESAIK